MAAGLINGHLQQPSIYPQLLPNDASWLASLQQDYKDASVRPVASQELIQEGVSLGKQPRALSLFGSIKLKLPVCKLDLQCVSVPVAEIRTVAGLECVLIFELLWQ